MNSEFLKFATHATKIPLLLLLAFLSMAFCFSMPEKSMLNSDTWFIFLGKKQIASSWKNNLGDTIVLSPKKNSPSDTLSFSRYFCGADALGTTTHLTLRNEKNDIIIETNYLNKTIAFEAKLSLNEIFQSPNFTKNKTFGIYLSYSAPDQGLTQTEYFGMIVVK